MVGIFNLLKVIFRLKVSPIKKAGAAGLLNREWEKLV
jgi:hypothetical protein